MEYKDYYRTLGVGRKATPEEIKRAYRKLARQYHPDRNKSRSAEARFKDINEANEVLSDPEKRRLYDQLGANWKNGQQFRPPPGWGGAAGGRARGGFGNGGAGGFSDFFSTLFGGAGPFGAGFEDASDGFGGFGGQGMGAGFGAPADQRATITIRLEDSFEGAERTVTLGGGRQLSVRIPKGITAGQTIRLSGQGAGGGHLLLEVQFAPHEAFRAEGRDVHGTLKLAPWEAALGARVPVRTLGGTVEMNIPAGSQAGKKLRLKGRGLPGTPPGDQILELQVVTPPADDAGHRAFYDEMANRFAGFKPRG